MSMNDPLFVVAYNYTAFLTWCRKKGYAPHNHSIIYVRDVDRIKRQKDIRILFLTGWEARKDARALNAVALVVGRRPS